MQPRDAGAQAGGGSSKDDMVIFKLLLYNFALRKNMNKFEPISQVN